MSGEDMPIPSKNQGVSLSYCRPQIISPRYMSTYFTEIGILAVSDNVFSSVG